LCSVITSISFDHTDRLGNTLAEIAYNKAGIIKDNCPVVTSSRAEEALQVFRKKAEDTGSEYFETKDTEVRIIEETLEGTKFDAKPGNTYYGLEISMKGEHQVENAVCALKAIEVLHDHHNIEIGPDAIYAGLKKAIQIGRFEIMRREPLVIIDGAHNPDGARTLKETCHKLLNGKRILMLTGMLKDKDREGILKQFMAVTSDFVVTEPDNPRKLSSDELKAEIEGLGGKAMAFADPDTALEEALKVSKDYDCLVCAGSLYLIGHLRARLI
ncbi:MAG: bifunctional folylpolyglutamate synthase/dihydrofolate synthase, partial [Firmicutes bacterium]|nr:bifunctional folylpolyglutamate synthase/dihydrofolate synthase [Bacillota bacterium]